VSPGTQGLITKRRGLRLSASDTTGSGDVSLTELMIVNNQDRSRDFYHNVMGAEIVRDRDPAILRLRNGVIVLNVGGSPTDDKPTVTMAPPPAQKPSAWP
jgi:hypothetical protein